MNINKPVIIIRRPEVVLGSQGRLIQLSYSVSLAMKELPPEIWIYISTFIPEAELRGLLGTNLLFYNICMNMRYRSIALQRFSPRTMKLLLRLADPAVGKRVRHLTASPDFRFYGAVRAPQSLSKRFFHNVLQSFRLSGSGPINRTPHRAEEKGTHALINALPAMQNVMAFTIDSHSWGQHSGTQLNTFLNTAWASFGCNLKKLSLRGHAASFRTIITSTPILPMVEELFFELIDNPLSSSNMVDDANTLVTVLAPFINSFASKLQALTLWAWSSLALSALFKSLAAFPLLTSFNFQTSFPRTLRDDSTSLSEFLTRHRAQIEILVLRLNTTPVLHSVQVEQVLSEWMLHTFEEIHFAHLRELQLYPSVLPKGFEALLTCIQLSAETLLTLVVRERYLGPEEVHRLFDVLPPNLRSLRLNIIEMDVRLFDVLAVKLPRLRSLSLYTNTASPDLNTFISEMRVRTYPGWKSCDVSVAVCGASVTIY